MLLEASGLTAGSRVQNVSFTLHRGEIIGLAGLMGAVAPSWLAVCSGSTSWTPARFESVANGSTFPIPARPSRQASR